MEHKKLVILVDFEDGVYPEIEPTTYRYLLDNEECAIRDFLEDCVSKGNRFKEEKGYYPKNLNELKKWKGSLI